MFEIRRTYRFCASVCLAREDWSEEKNLRVFGAASIRPGHGHNFRLTVVVSGEPDPETARVVDVAALDALVGERVVRIYDHRNLNLDVPELRGRVPTLEVLLRDIWGRLAGRLPAGRLVELVLHEDELLCASYAGGGTA